MAAQGATGFAPAADSSSHHKNKDKRHTSKDKEKDKEKKEDSEEAKEETDGDDDDDPGDDKGGPDPPGSDDPSSSEASSSDESDASAGSGRRKKKNKKKNKSKKKDKKDDLREMANIEVPEFPTVAGLERYRHLLYERAVLCAQNKDEQKVLTWLREVEKEGKTHEDFADSGKVGSGRQYRRRPFLEMAVGDLVRCRLCRREGVEKHARFSRKAREVFPKTTRGFRGPDVRLWSPDVASEVFKKSTRGFSKSHAWLSRAKYVFLRFRYIQRRFQAKRARFFKGARVESYCFFSRGIRTRWSRRFLDLGRVYAA